MTLRSQIGIFIILLACVIALLHNLAFHYFFYWAYWWFDLVIHALAGIFVGATVVWFVRFEVPIGIRPRVPVFVLAITLALVVGILWEAFEYFIGARPPRGYLADTLLDIAMALIGAGIAYIALKKI